MKTVILSLIAVLLGLGIGIGTSVREFSFSDQAESISPTTSHATPPPRGEGRAVIVGSEVHHFGTMERNSTRSHIFRIRNDGDGNLVLSNPRSTCKCTNQRFSRMIIPPGEMTEMFIEWQPTDYAVMFRQTATVSSNDPHFPDIRFTIEGRVDQAIRPIPERLHFGSIVSSDAREATMRVFCYRDLDFEILSAALTEANDADHYAIDFRPLTEEEIASEPMAQSGYLITATLSPGLPMGPLQQGITLTTNTDLLPEITIPMSGQIVSDISFFGNHQFDRDNLLLDLGDIDRSQGTHYRMWILIKGPHREGVVIEPDTIVPADLLQVEIGPPESMGKTVRYLMEIQVPADSPPASHLGNQDGRLGRILLKTTHPQASEVSIYVRFAVN